MAKASWQGTNLPRVGGFNRAVVLDAIRQRGEVSRVELAQRTGLTPQTMSNIVRALIADGLVTENGHAPSTGGKRRVLLKVVPDAYTSVGLHLDPEQITGVLLDLAGGVRLRSRRRVPTGAAPSAVATALTRTFQQLVRRSGVDSERVLGVGLAVPGPLDAEHRQVLAPPNLAGWSAVPLADIVAERAGLPVVMDNDATAAAIGERWAGCAERAGSFVYVYLGSGVGIGVVLNDQVHRGVSNNAGEIGHVHSGGSRRCHCGRRGCLEAYCSMRAIVADWQAAGGKPEGDSVAAAYERMCRRAAGGDAAAVKVLRQAATRLGQVLASVVSVLDVDRVVLGGPALRHVAELVRSRVAKVVAAQVWAPQVRPVQVQTALIGEDAGAVGAASLVLDHAYSPRLATLLGS
ncbi:sugar kinase [Saccharopolyspora subtropica]|uniref:ROK family transcriptional regulator n=1 Tax=Saccharopolyspora thermophila TaxID=89367 RepID=A0A917JS64_9PSEU|nr:ROK family transcriptional regulator [Saccharopolyspora subtropica]GGI83521.1 sugar kinase [Saccharopolyspora subtropica]